MDVCYSWLSGMMGLQMLIACVLSSCAPYSSDQDIRTDIQGAAGFAHIYRPYSTLAHPRTDMVVGMPNPEVQAASRQVFDDKGNPYYVIEAGGAILLSPSLLLLTDHQIVGDSAPIHIPEHGLVQSTIIHSEVFEEAVPDEGRSQLGWEIRRIDPPAKYQQVAVLTDSLQKYKGKQGLIPVSKKRFHVLNRGRLRDRSISPNDSTVFVEGEIMKKHPQQASFLPPHYFEGNSITIRVDHVYDMRGSSGFPVLVYDDELDAWITLGVVLAEVSDLENGKLWMIAFYFSPKNLEAIEPDSTKNK